tara:strand:- start:338 stop:520 length:183 start_codon:yes stop_codon:yes gene_type:complete
MWRDLYKLLSLFVIGAIIVCCGEFEGEPIIEPPQLEIGEKSHDSGYESNQAENPSHSKYE